MGRRRWIGLPVASSVVLLAYACSDYGGESPVPPAEGGAPEAGDDAATADDGPSADADASTCDAGPADSRWLSDAVDIALGSGFACAVRASGDVVCWGTNQHGELGTTDAGAPPSSNVPRK